MTAQYRPCWAKFYRSLRHHKNLMFVYIMKKTLWHSQSQVSLSLYMSQRARLPSRIFAVSENRAYKPPSNKSRTKKLKICTKAAVFIHDLTVPFPFTCWMGPGRAISRRITFILPRVGSFFAFCTCIILKILCISLLQLLRILKMSNI